MVAGVDAAAAAATAEPSLANGERPSIPPIAVVAAAAAATAAAAALRCCWLHCCCLRTAGGALGDVLLLLLLLTLLTCAGKGLDVALEPAGSLGPCCC